MGKIAYDKKDDIGYNYGLAVLRIWMCFEVVIAHNMNWDIKIEDQSWVIRMMAQYREVVVPVFMVTSFILTDMSKLASNKTRIKSRFYRLLVPHVFWAVAYFVVYKLLDMKKGYTLEHGISDLFWQLALGHSLNQTEWFQIDIIILTLLFVILFRFCSKEVAIKATIVIGYVALLLQYTGINGMIFDNVRWKDGFQTDYVTFPVGRICEMIPYAVLGIIICTSHVLEKLKKNRTFIIFGMVLFLYLLFNYSVFSIVDPQYGYSGFRQIALGTATVMLFYYLPLQWLPNVAKQAIRFLAKYTMAVYFMHRLVATVLYKTRLHDDFRLHWGTIRDSIIIYVFCVLAAWIISLIPVELIRKTVI